MNEKSDKIWKERKKQNDRKIKYRKQRKVEKCPEF